MLIFIILLQHGYPAAENFGFVFLSCARKEPCVQPVRCLSLQLPLVFIELS
jgi:hypothetical protein